MRWIGLLAAALALCTSCDNACETTCLDGVSVALPANTLVEGKSYGFHMCIDGSCTDGLVSPINKGAICTSDLWLCEAALGTPSGVTVLFIDRTFLTGAPTRQVTFALTAGGQTVAQRSGTVTVQPPPGACTCRAATLGL